jgi:hypothetical protein
MIILFYIYNPELPSVFDLLHNIFHFARAVCIFWRARVCVCVGAPARARGKIQNGLCCILCFVCTLDADHSGRAA